MENKEFKNTVKQNITIFLIAFATQYLLRTVTHWGPLRPLLFKIEPKMGMLMLNDYLAFYVFILLPFKPFRRFTWNRIIQPTIQFVRLKVSKQKEKRKETIHKPKETKEWVDISPQPYSSLFVDITYRGKDDYTVHLRE